MGERRPVYSLELELPFRGTRIAYHIVDVGSLMDMRPLQIIPATDGTRQTRLGRRVDQAEIGIDIGRLLL